MSEIMKYIKELSNKFDRTLTKKEPKIQKTIKLKYNDSMESGMQEGVKISRLDFLSSRF